MKFEKRDETLDIAKGFCIIFMVIGHCYSKENLILILIYGFHMPMFFVVSGLIYAKKIKENRNYTFDYCRNIMRLGKAYLLYSVAFSVFLGAFRPNDFFEIQINNTINIIKLRGVSVLWYLPCICLVESIFFATKKLGDNVSKKICLLMYLIPFLFPSDGIILPLERCFIGLGFFSLGFYFLGGVMDFQSGKKKKISWGLLFVIYILFSIKNDMVSLVKLQFGNPLLYTITSVIGCILMLEVSVWLAQNASQKLKNVIILLGQNTLFILGTHMFLVEIVRLLDYYICGDFLKKLGSFEGIVFGAGVSIVLYFLLILKKSVVGSATREKRI